MESVELLVVVAPGADHERQDRLARRLRAEIAEADIERVVAGGGSDRPAGAKAGGLGNLGQLLVTVTASGGALARLVGLLADWLKRQPGNERLTVSIGDDRIELHPTADQQQKIVEAFLARHDAS